MNYFQFPVSFGTILVSWNSQGLLSQIEWSENRLALWQRVRVPAVWMDLVDQLRAYFYQGEPLSPICWELIDRSGWTDFQFKVYQVISQIPHGETRTYGWVARRVGKDKAYRAVGQALKKNPLPILIPCHRVTASDSIGGFMGKKDLSHPELQLKKRLVLLEEEYCSPGFSFLIPSSRTSFLHAGSST